MQAALTTEQRAAAEALGHSLITGAAGTGKTTVLLNKLAHLVDATGRGRVAIMAPTAAALARWPLTPLTPTVTLTTFAAAASSACQAAGAPRLRLLSLLEQHELWAQALRLSGATLSRAAAMALYRARFGQRWRPASAQLPAVIQAFLTLCEKHQVEDDLQCLRRHLHYGRQGTPLHAAYDHIVVDQLESLTPLEVTWLIDQALAGATLQLAACPALLPPAAADNIALLVAALPLRRYHLSQAFRQPDAIAQALEGLSQGPAAAPLPLAAPWTVLSRSFSTPDEEIAAAVASLRAQQQAHPTQTWGMLTATPEQAYGLHQHLQQHHIAHHTVGLPALSEEPAAALVYAAARLLAGQGDTAALARVLWWSLGLEAMALAPQLASQDWASPEALWLPPTSRRLWQAVHQLRQEYQMARQLLQQHPYEIKAIIGGLVAPCLATAPATERTAAQRALQLLQQSGPFSPLQVGCWPQLAAPPSPLAGLWVAPLQAAHGLEADTVYLVGFGQTTTGTPPSAVAEPLSATQALYLGLSRARQGVVISYVGSPHASLRPILARPPQAPHLTPLPAAVA